MKLRLEVENWSGTSVEAIYQDFHATLFTKNLSALLESSRWTDKSQRPRLSGQYGESLLQDERYRCFSVQLCQSITRIAQALVTDDTDDWAHSSKPRFSQEKAPQAQAFLHELQTIALT